MQNTDFLEYGFKMEPLASIEQILVWLNMFPYGDDDSSSKWSRMVRISFPLVIFIISLFAVIAFGTFIVTNITSNLEECLFTFMGFMMSICATYAIVVAYFSRNQVPSIFEDLATICNDSMYNVYCS